MRPASAQLFSGSLYVCPTRGCTARVIADYDLFENNINDCVGIYLKTDQQTKKHLIYFPEVSEWAELDDDSVIFDTPDEVPPNNQEFVDRVKQLPISCPT